MDGSCKRIFDDGSTDNVKWKKLNKQIKYIKVFLKKIELKEL